MNYEKGVRGFIKTKPVSPLLNSNIYKKYLKLLNEEGELGMLEFLQTFNSDDECLELLFIIKQLNSNCKKCGSPIIDSYSRVDHVSSTGVKRKMFACSRCGQQESATSNTIMEKTTTEMNKWFYAIFNCCANIKNTTALQMEKNMNVCYKTSHRMLKVIRFALYQNMPTKLKGVVEVDEAFLSSSGVWSRWGNICSTRKQPIVGLIERGTSRLIISLVDDRNIKTLDELILNNVEKGSVVYTDGWRGYNGLKKYFVHDFVEHSRNEYVRDDVHTNTIENVWKNFKTNIRGSHNKVGYKYVQNYVDEFVWKWNNRQLTPMQRFDNALKRILHN